MLFQHGIIILNNYFIFFEGANIRLFPYPAILFLEIFIKYNFTKISLAFYQLALVTPGIKPNKAISRNVTRLTPNVLM